MKDQNSIISIPQIFGHESRTRYLVGIAIHGPIRARALGRLLDIDCGRLPGFFRDFQRLGVIYRDGDGYICLDDSFFAFSELTILLRAIAGERVIVLPGEAADSRAKRIPLFGSMNRTRVLVALSAVGSINLKGLAFVANVHPRTVHGVVNRLAADGVATCERDAANRMVELCDEFRLMPVLRPLLRCLQDAFTDIARRANGYKGLVADRAQLVNAIGDGNSTLPIGTPLQARALVALATFGTLTTTTLAEAIGASHSTARTIALELADYDLIVARAMGSGPQRKRWLRLNEQHPVTAPLRHLVMATSGCKRRSGVPLPPTALPNSKPVRSKRLPGHPLRLRVFIETYANGTATVREMAERLDRSDWGPIRRWATDLHEADLLDYGVLNGRMVLQPKRDGPGAGPLRALARAMQGFQMSR